MPPRRGARRDGSWPPKTASVFGELFDRTPQTNEVARSMPLLGGLLAIVDATRLPVALLDVGSSAGLNLRLDRYRYEGDGWFWGDPHSPLVLRNETISGQPRTPGKFGRRSSLARGATSTRST